MRKRRLLGIILAMAMILTITVFSQDNVSAAGTDRVLLIQNELPWGSTVNSDMLGQLQSLGYLAGYDVHTFAEINDPAFDLSVYRLIVVASAQDQASYDQYNAVSKSKLEDFAFAGGVVMFSACDAAGNGMLTETLPGGVEKVNNYQGNNYIVDSGNPVVTGVLSANNDPLSDLDLVGDSCSHTSFVESTLPSGSVVILRGTADAAPTLVDCPYGSGQIILSGLTWEYSYFGNYSFAVKAYDDLLLYSLSLPQDAPSGLAGAATSFADESDGKIIGTSAAMEYRLSSAADYTPASDTDTAGLSAGTYYVRYAEKDGYFASPDTEVIVADGPVRTYMLTVTAPVFSDLVLGASRPDAKVITIANSGNSDAAVAGVTVSGSSFTIAGSGAAVPAGGSIDTWTIQPAAGLALGTYTGTVTVTFNDGASATADVRINVVPRVDAAAPVFTTNISGTQTIVKGASASPLTVKAESADGGVITYQWYVKNGEAGVPAAVSGATSASYTPKTDAAGVFYYHVVAVNTNSAVNGTNSAQLGSGEYKIVVNTAVTKTGETADAAPYVLLAAGIVCAAGLVMRKRRAGSL